MRIAGAEAEVARQQPIVNGSAALRTRAEEDLKALIETFADEQTPSPAPLPASSVVNQELSLIHI